MFERLKFHQTGGQLLFHLISPPYERTSVIITTNLAFGDWPCVLPHRHSAHAAMAGDPGIITAALIENQGSPETLPWSEVDSNLGPTLGIIVSRSLLSSSRTPNGDTLRPFDDRRDALARL